MTGLVTHHVRVALEVTSLVELNEYQGAALRGSLIGALRRHYCDTPGRIPGNKDAVRHSQNCPACRLIAAEDASRQRGQNPPRPYVIEPPSDNHTRYLPQDRLEFGLGLFTEAPDLYPYLLTALALMGHEGLGRRTRDNQWRRGGLALRRIEATNPLTRQHEVIYEDGAKGIPALPRLPVTADMAVREATRWPADRVTLRFLTPTRLIEGGRLAGVDRFRVVLQRLLERIIELWRTYGEGDLPFDVTTLVASAEQVTCVGNDTQWMEVRSFSNRTAHSVPISGWVGTATYEGDLAPFMPWLLWGQCLHVGKNAVKGCGWYELLP